MTTAYMKREAQCVLYMRSQAQISAFITETDVVSDEEESDSKIPFSDTFYEGGEKAIQGISNFDP